jgi:signal transduction histidine kinase
MISSGSRLAAEQAALRCVGGADPSGHGLAGLGDRVTAMDGQFVVESPEGGGTLLAAWLPVCEPCH